jgi:hypothetical protein
MNKCKFAVAMALVFSAIASTQSLAMADDVKTPKAAISAPAATAVKYDVDYMDEGVRVIIPKMLAETKVKAGGFLRYLNSKEEMNVAVKDAYIANGFNFDQTAFFVHGDKYSQSIAFKGNKEQLKEVNLTNGKARLVDGAITGAGVVVRGALGYVLGGVAAGSTGSAAGLGAGVLGGNGLNKSLESARSAVFDGYDQLPVNEGDTVVIYGVSSPEGKSTVILITPNIADNEQVLIRGILKAQNIVATQ